MQSWISHFPAAARAGLEAVADREADPVVRAGAARVEGVVLVEVEADSEGAAVDSAAVEVEGVAAEVVVAVAAVSAISATSSPTSPTEHSSGPVGTQH